MQRDVQERARRNVDDQLRGVRVGGCETIMCSNVPVEAEKRSSRNSARDKMDPPHRVFAAAKPYVAPRRRKALTRAVSLRKYGLTPAELAKVARRLKGECARRGCADSAAPSPCDVVCVHCYSFTLLSRPHATQRSTRRALLTRTRTRSLLTRRTTTRARRHPMRTSAPRLRSRKLSRRRWIGSRRKSPQRRRAPPNFVSASSC